MDTYYFDWAHGKVDVLKNEETQVQVFHSLDALLDRIKEPSRLIGEATFESFFRDSKRNDIISRCEEEGHTLLTTANRATGKWKVKLYPPDTHPEFYTNNAKFPDDLAVDIIRRIAKSGYHLKVPRRYDPNDPWLPLREAACRDLMILRNTKTIEVGPRGGEKLVSKQDKLADEMMPFLVRYGELPDRQARSLGNGKSYSGVLVATTAVAAKYVSNTKEFDKLSGLYAHGYPTQFRSNYNYWGLRFALNRAAEAKAGRKLKKGEKSTQILTEGEVRSVRTDFRYSCRWLYHQLKEVVVA